ncbi:MAG: F0F1 ATP synthase subunit epsilon, partial [Sphingomonadaceae bacterium]|nr:F0F1 ATP synthase subunit epsilon [Sphingomonadaceae bacterium]
DAFMVVVPGSEGDFGVLHGHMPVMTTIRDSEIRVYSSPNTVSHRIRVTGGFAEVNASGLTVLAEQAMLGQ